MLEKIDFKRRNFSLYTKTFQEVEHEFLKVQVL